MIDPAALLPNESPCSNPSCEDGRVAVYVACHSSAAEEPALATGRWETCQVCDGTQVEVTENRSTPRASADPDFLAWVDVRNRLTIAELENESLRGTCAEWKRLTDEYLVTVNDVRADRDRYKAAATARAAAIHHLQDELARKDRIIDAQNAVIDKSDYHHNGGHHAEAN